MAECLPDGHEALGSIHGTTRRKIALYGVVLFTFETIGIFQRLLFLPG